ncbi:MAG: recombinase family protein, partial [Gammaproteobacteria bacterium]|nr:recombinase family protein [Gammaproteobacteria bacterium]
MSNIIDISDRLQARQAIILTRVSSKEQEEGYSIDAQRHRLETYCNRRGLDVIRIFELVESSTSGDRRQFMAMIKFVKSQKQPIAIVADKVDRVQRSFKEYPLLDALIQQGRIELHFNTENYVIHKDSVSQERLMWSMGVIMAQSYIDSMRDNVKRSFEQKIRTGGWIAKAPLGYLNAKDGHGRSTVIVDDDRAPLVRRLFEEYATGAFTLREMVIKSKEWGLKNQFGNKSWLQRSQVHKILNNPFYYGQMRIKDVLHDHSYTPLIHKALYDQCQAVMKGWNKKPFQWGGKEFIFRGLITCAATGKTVTASTQKKRYKNGGTAEWTYLRCWNPENPEKMMWVREDDVLQQVEDVFKSLCVPQATLEKLTEHLRQTDQTERAFVRRQMGELQREQAMIQGRLDNLMDLLLDGIVSKEDFEKKRERLRGQQIDIEGRMAAHRESDHSFKDAFLSLLSLASGAHDLYTGSTIEQKRELMNVIFANLTLDGRTLCYSLRKPFDLFAKCDDPEKWQ